MNTASLPLHELAALGTALCWAVTPLVSSVPANHLGAFAFNRLRQISVAVLLAAFVTISGRWHVLSLQDFSLLLVSGVIGIFVGDTLLFAALNRLGPRRNGVVFALNAPIAAILGWLLLEEDLSLWAIAGIVLTILGVMLAILFGKRPGQPGQSHRLEDVTGPLWVGVALCLGAAMGQAAGSIMMRPLMAAGVDPFLASLLRVGVAAFCLTSLIALPIDVVKPRAALNIKMAGLTIASGVLAMGLGMTLLLFALSGGKTGIIATLSATSPVMILPLLWMTTGTRPAAGAWAGAALVVCGMAFLFAGRT